MFYFAENNQQSNADGAPPQTPHTADCISKIQAIQRDVLELMLAVEQFGGKRGDKDYIYLDEMLTRNLLKLDTIDTNGRESIRMARKEAIKCIQTSIAVLEAKADLHLNEKLDNGDQANEDKTEAAEPTPSDAKTGEVKMDVEDTKGDASADNAADATEIPKVENMNIDDDSSNTPATQDEQQTKAQDNTENADTKKWAVIATWSCEKNIKHFNSNKLRNVVEHLLNDHE